MYQSSFEVRVQVGSLKALAHLLAGGFSIWGWPEAVPHLHTSSFLFLTSQEHLNSNG